MDLFWIALIILFASLVKGITGFGFALVSLPLLMNWYSPKELIPVLFLCNLSVSIIIVFQKKQRKLVSKQFKLLIIYGAIFTIFGVLALNYISEGSMITVMSIFLIILSILALSGIKYSAKLTNVSYKVAGSVVGFLTGFMSISGPPLALFLHSAKTDNQEFREVFAWFSIITASIAIVSFALLGMLTTTTLRMIILFLPILFIGSYFGKKLNHSISHIFFNKAVIFLSLIASIALLFRQYG